METNMKEQEIIEGNKLIAEFMGDFKLIKEFKPEPDVDITYMWKKISNKSFGYDTTDWRDYSTDTEYSDRVCYNYSWDWLMPVFKKIWESIDQFQYDDEPYLYITEEIFHPDYLLSDFINNNIEGVWNRCVEFIKMSREKPRQIETDEWLYKGCFIQKSSHPKFVGNYEVFKNNETQDHVGRCYTFTEAKSLCKENECNDDYLKF